MSKALRHQVGRLIIAGLEGPVLTATEKAWLNLIRPGGIILFRRNIEEAEQTSQLLHDATAAIGHEIFRCVDLEGGLVDRLRDLVAPMPSPAEVFATGKPSLYKKHGQLIAREAGLLGFNTVFAPVLDLALPASSSVMRSRVVSADPQGVIAYAAAFLKGLAAENILGCGKHFPGLGGGTFDSHHFTPHIERSWNELWNQDLVPYRALVGSLPMIMVSHAIYPAASKKATPASVSSYWISTILRKKIDFQGLIVSDDMEMGGILSQLNIEEAAIEAIAAGTHLIEICKDPALMLRAYEALLTEAERSTAFRNKIQTAEDHISKFQKKWLIKPIKKFSQEKVKAVQSQIILFKRSFAGVNL